MRKEMKLKCTVGRLDETGRHTVITKMFDGTEVSLRAFGNELTMNSEFNEETSVVQGWLFVVTEGQQGDRVAITLPQPSDIHGRQIVVNQYELMPRHVTIDSFGPVNR